mgnify:FL=1
MAAQRLQTATGAEDPQFDLNISIVESGPVISDLMRLTEDGWGTTCESACPTQSGC